MEELEKNLETYRLQLMQIESAISSGQNDDELLSLQQEMKELIGLTEESVLEYKKSNLLTMLDESDKNTGIIDTPSNTQEKDSSSMDDIMASFYADISSSETTTISGNKENPQDTVTSNNEKFSQVPFTSHKETKTFENSLNEYNDLGLNEDFLKTIEDLEDITGTRCQAPFETEWSGRQYHNAMISSVNSSEEQPAAISVEVFFLNPTLLEMKPCPYYLDGKCRFDVKDCKFSHGFSVSLYHLRKFQEPNFSNFHPGSDCLAKTPNGIWQPASLVQTFENHQYEIKFLQQDLISKLDIDDVLPLSCNDDSSSSDGEDNDENIDEDKVVIINDTISYDSDTSKSSLGKWEKFTTGFGSKMLKKYGYQMGDGLGKDKNGRVEPVPVVVLPPGKSLDHCMRLKEKKMGVVDDSATSSQHRRKQRHTVFNFLNKTLGDKRKGDNYLRKLLPKDSFGIKKEKAKSGACRISVELVKNDSKIKQLREKIKSYKISINRNRTRDPGVAKKQEAKLNKAIAELKSIQSNNKVIELHQNRADTHRKMTKF